MDFTTSHHRGSLARVVGGFGFALLCSSWWGSAATAATITVGRLFCKLPDAILSANTDTAVGGCVAGSPGLDTIVVTPPEGVTLTTVAETADGPNGLPTITSPIFLDGRGHLVLRSHAAPAFRLLRVGPGGTLTLHRITVAQGLSESNGGAILNYGTLILESSEIGASSVVGAAGGAIHNEGTLVVYRSAIADNKTENVATNTVVGGGISNLGTAEITESNIFNNSVVDSSVGGLLALGGGLYNAGDMTITSTTIATNYGFGAGGAAGAIYDFDGTLEIVNSTFSNNSATLLAGGIYSDSDTPVVLSHVTFSGNSSALGNGGGSFSATATLIADSTDSNCLPGTVVSGSYNLADEDSCSPVPSTLTGLDPVLADHGGPGFTHALLAGSNAIDHAGACGLSADQRNAPRVGACDAGSFEWLGCPRLVLSDDLILTQVSYSECAISVDSGFEVAGPDGDLTLTFGSATRFLSGVAIGSGGKLRVKHEPALELVQSQAVERELRRRAADGPPPAPTPKGTRPPERP